MTGARRCPQQYHGLPRAEAKSRHDSGQPGKYCWSGSIPRRKLARLEERIAHLPETLDTLRVTPFLRNIQQQGGLFKIGTEVQSRSWGRVVPLRENRDLRQHIAQQVSLGTRWDQSHASCAKSRTHREAGTRTLLPRQPLWQTRERSLNLKPGCSRRILRPNLGFLTWGVGTGGDGLPQASKCTQKGRAVCRGRP